jgi:hypothetical protein
MSRPFWAPNIPLYESNRKHKEPWQPGARGLLCPPDLHAVAQKLLDESDLLGNKRYAVHEGKAFCAQQHAEARWHGYPILWREVPEPVRRKWLNEGKIVRRDLKT